MDERRHTQLTARLDLATHRRHLAFSETPPKIAAGMLFVLAALCLIWWLESDLKKPKSIEEEMARKVVPASVSIYLPQLENRLVYLSGPIRVSTPVGDEGYLKPQQVVRLERVVEIYQYTGGLTKTRSPLMAWRSTDRSLAMPKNSKFKNPTPKIRSQIFTSKIMLGPLDASRVKLPNSMALPLALKPAMQQNRSHFTDGKWLYPGGRRPPRLGDIRISYKAAAPAQKISVIAVQKKKSIVPFVSSFGSK